MKYAILACTAVLVVVATAIGLNGGPSESPSANVVPTAGPPAEMQDTWFFRTPGIESVRAIEGKPAPELQVRTWRDRAVTLEQLRGDIVVVDFWGTWCPPCVAALPKNESLWKKYRDQGVTFVGVCTENRSEQMDAVAGRNNLSYPLGIDNQDRTAREWGVRFYPTYAIVDHTGIVRAAGLVPGAVENAIRACLAARGGGSTVRTSSGGPADSVTSTVGSEPDRSWYERQPDSDRYRNLDRLVKREALPSIASRTWMNIDGDAMDLEDLKGKIVVLDFWGTWCRPCIQSIPHNNHLAKTYEKDGVVIIGVCDRRQVDRMAEVVKEHGITYPVCADTTGRITKAYDVDGFPDYYLIDRKGRLRIADCRNQKIEDAIRWLVREQPLDDDAASQRTN